MNPLLEVLRTAYRQTVPQSYRLSLRRLRLSVIERLSSQISFRGRVQPAAESHTATDPISPQTLNPPSSINEKEDSYGHVAEQISAAVRKLMVTEQQHTYFDLWQKQGFHVTPNHFYQPIPDTSTLTETLWQKPLPLYGINMNQEGQRKLLREDFPRFAEEYNRFPREKPSSDFKFYFDNGTFGGTDALVAYCMVRHFKPNLVIEVGSGYSTLMMSEAAKQNGHTRLICIEPYPLDFLNPKALGIEQLIAEKVQDVNPAIFSQLSQGDILFIDTSHTVKIGSDVNYLFFHVLPLLKPGVIIHLHDIFLPDDYPKSWVLDLHLFWNEQYLLQAFLMYNTAFDVLFSNSFMGKYDIEEMKRVFPFSPWWGGGSFWMQRNFT